MNSRQTKRYYILLLYYLDIEHYREAADNFISVMDHLAKQVEREKREAIIVSNKLASLPNKAEEEMAMLQVISSKNYYKLIEYNYFDDSHR